MECGLSSRCQSVCFEGSTGTAGGIGAKALMDGAGGNGMIVWAGGASNCNLEICKQPLCRMVYNEYMYTYLQLYIH